jgi:hypothetical protein
MKTLYDNLNVIDLTEEVAQRRQASRSHFMYKDGVREATKDATEYLEANGLICTRDTSKRPSKSYVPCLADKDGEFGVKCAELKEYLKDMYYTGKTKFFVE